MSFITHMDPNWFWFSAGVLMMAAEIVAPGFFLTEQNRFEPSRFPPEYSDTTKSPLSAVVERGGKNDFTFDVKK